MKKTTSFLVTLFTLLCSMVAMAEPINVKVVVDDPATMKCQVAYNDYELKAGVNEFNVEPYSQLVFESVSPYYIDKVTNEAGTPQDGVVRGCWYKYVYPADEGQTYTIIVTNLEEQRDSEFTLNIDDPSLVHASLSGYDQEVTLQAGKNTVKFNSEKENSLTIQKADYTKEIYEVLLDGKEQLPSYSTFYVPLTPGCVVDVTAIVPEKEITVTFNYSEEGKGAIQEVKVGDTAVADFDGTTVKMMAGQTLSLVPYSAYKIDEVKFNGVTNSWKGGYTYSTPVMKDLVIDINAHPYGTYNITVKVDNPENIILYRGSKWDNDIITLTEGENPVTVQENSASIAWAPADDAFIKSITANGTEVDVDYASTTVTDGMVIEFVTAKIVYDRTAVVWVDNKDGLDTFTLAGGNNRVAIPVNSGYNVVEFYEKMVPFMFSSWPAAKKIYLDGVEQAPSYPGGSYYELPVVDNSVLKIFCTSEPETCNVTFDAAEGVEATVKYDILKTLTSLADGLTCFKGTQISISGDENLTVKVGDTDLTKDEEGNFVFTVADAATTVTLSTITSGIENVTVSADNADNAVYNLMGVRVGKVSDLNDLPQGIYIVNGQKVVNK